MAAERWRVLTPTAYREMPWKNGLGVTTEIISVPRAAGDGFAWRISRAKIAASGPFSSFPHYDRIIMHLGGGAVSLTHDGADPLPLRPFTPHAFSGDAVTTAMLAGEPADDFNLMMRRGECRGLMVFDDLPPGTPHLLAAAKFTTHYVYVLSGLLEVVGPEAKLTVSELSSCVGPADEPVRLRALAPRTRYILTTITLGTAATPTL